MNISQIIVENITDFVNTTDIVNHSEGMPLTGILLIVFGIILLVCMAGAGFG
jgi:hypothetical protein